MIPLVSILIPAYNAERWIGETLKSAINQTWRRVEIIVVDDGSRDRTLMVANRSASSKVKVVTQPNQGASAARNHALRLCQGDYIQWLDADDVLHSDKISLQLERMSGAYDDRVLLSSAWGKFQGNTQNAIFQSTSLWQDLAPADWLRLKLEQNLWMGIQSWLVSRTITDLAGPWDCTLTRDDDGEYFCRVLCVSRAVRFVSSAKSYVRVGNTNSLSHDASLSDQKLESQLQSIACHINSLLSLEDSPRTRLACMALLQRWYIYFYPEKSHLVARADELARGLGGVLRPPDLPLKYRIIQKLFGWRLAKKVIFDVPKPRAVFDSLVGSLR